MVTRTTSGTQTIASPVTRRNRVKGTLGVEFVDDATDLGIHATLDHHGNVRDLASYPPKLRSILLKCMRDAFGYAPASKSATSAYGSITLTLYHSTEEGTGSIDVGIQRARGTRRVVVQDWNHMGYVVRTFVVRRLGAVGVKVAGSIDDPIKGGQIEVSLTLDSATYKIWIDKTGISFPKRLYSRVKQKAVDQLVQMFRIGYANDKFVKEKPEPFPGKGRRLSGWEWSGEAASSREERIERSASGSPLPFQAFQGKGRRLNGKPVRPRSGKLPGKKRKRSSTGAPTTPKGAFGKGRRLGSK